jgi:hypothetical protein
MYAVPIIVLLPLSLKTIETHEESEYLSDLRLLKTFSIESFVSIATSFNCTESRYSGKLEEKPTEIVLPTESSTIETEAFPLESFPARNILVFDTRKGEIGSLMHEIKKNRNVLKIVNDIILVRFLKDIPSPFLRRSLSKPRR